MKADYYADIDLLNKSGIPIPILAAQVLRLLHPLMSEQPNTYALAFPAMKAGDEAGLLPQLGRVLRLFSASREAIEKTLDRLEIESGLMDDAPHALPIHLGRVRSVPPIHTGEWVSYHRFRIPARKGKSPQHQEKRLRLRAKRLHESRLLPYLVLQSASTRQTFSLMIQQQAHPAPGALEGIPDGYGLSPQATPVILPKLPCQS